MLNNKWVRLWSYAYQKLGMVGAPLFFLIGMAIAGAVILHYSS